MSDEQLAGLVVPEQQALRVESAVRKACTAAQLDERDQGAAELAAAAARGVDLALGRRDPFAVAAAVRELRETLTRLRMDPASREGSDAGEVASWLAQLANPEGDDVEAADRGS
jgi:hypothetical protein